MNNRALRAIFASYLLFAPASAFSAQRPAEAGLERSRQLVQRFELEYLQLAKKNTYAPSRSLDKKMALLKEKILLVDENRDQVLSALPEKAQAQEFLKDAISKKNVFGLRKNMASPKAHALRLHERALKLTEHQRFDEAIKTYQEILILDPHDDQAYLIMGHLYLMTNHVQDSESAFFNAIDIDASNRDEILPFYQNLILQNPDDVNYTFLGYASLILGDNSGAEAAFKEALSINPTNEKARSGINFFKRA